MPDEAEAVAAPGSSPPFTRFTANVSLPQKFDTKGNLAANWKKWIQIWKAYEIVTGLDKQPSTLRVATFITCIGPDALEIHTGLPFQSDDERQNIDKVLELRQNYCIGKTNVIYERYRFNNRLQESDESIDAYTTALRTLAETCEFGSLKEDLIRDRLVCGIRDNSLRKKLLQEPKLTLGKCLDSCRAAEATKLQMQAMTSQNNESSDVNALKSSSEKSNEGREGVKWELGLALFWTGKMGFTHWDWDLATGNGMNNYKMGMGFLFFSGLCSNILK